MKQLTSRYTKYYDKKEALATDKISEQPFEYGLPREVKKEMKPTKLSWGESVISSYVSSLSFDALIGSSLAPSITNDLRTSTATLALSTLVRNACISGVSFYFASKDSEDMITLTSRETLLASDGSVALSSFPDGNVYLLTQDAMVCLNECSVLGEGSRVGVGSGLGVGGARSVLGEGSGLGVGGARYVDSARSGLGAPVGGVFTCGDGCEGCTNHTSKTLLSNAYNPTCSKTPPKITPTKKQHFEPYEHNDYTAYNLSTNVNNGNTANNENKVSIPLKLKTFFYLNSEFYEVEILAEEETILTDDIENAIYELSLYGLNDTSKKTLKLLSNFYAIDINNSIANFGKIAINEREYSSSDFGRSLLSATFENAYKQAIKFKMLQNNISYMSVLNKNLLIAQGIEKEYTDSRSGQTVQNLESNSGQDFSGVPTIFAESETANIQANNLIANDSLEIEKAFNGEVLKVSGELGISPSILGVSMKLESHEVESYNKVFNEKISQLRKELSPQIKRFIALYQSVYNGDDFDVVNEEVSKCEVVFENTPQIDKIAGLGDAIFKAMDKGISFPQSYVNRMFGISQYEIYRDNVIVQPTNND